MGVQRVIICKPYQILEWLQSVWVGLKMFKDRKAEGNYLQSFAKYKKIEYNNWQSQIFPSHKKVSVLFFPLVWAIHMWKIICD